MGIKDFFSRGTNYVRKVGMPVMSGIRKLGMPATNVRGIANTVKANSSRALGGLNRLVDNVDSGLNTVSKYSNQGSQLYKKMRDNDIIPQSRLGDKAVKVLDRLGTLSG